VGDVEKKAADLDALTSAIKAQATSLYGSWPVAA
jgi:hypothetical protein